MNFVRSLDCAGLVTNFMGMAVSYGIADKAFLNSTKPKVRTFLIKRSWKKYLQLENAIQFSQPKILYRSITRFTTKIN